MAASEPDAATQALIAQLMAEDFSEAYDDQMRPIGSYCGDYEEPLTSYERQCLEDPNGEIDEEVWDPPTPTYTPEVNTPTLPEGQSWDSSINNDPRIEARSPEENADEGSSSSKNGLKDEKTDSQAGDVRVSEPLHQLHDPIGYHSQANLTTLTLRHVSEPNHELRAPVTVNRRNISDPPHLETGIHENYNYETEAVDWSRSSPEPSSPKEQRPLDHTVFSLFDLGPTIATNERLLPFYDSNGKLLLDEIASKRKVKNLAESPLPRTEPIEKMKLNHESAETIPDSKDSCKPSYIERRHSDPAPTSPSTRPSNPLLKGKGKVSIPDNPPAPPTRPLPHLRLPFEDAEVSMDKASGLPLLRIPWPGSSPGERAFAETMEGVVHEIRIGEEESVDSILMDMWKKEELEVMECRRDEKGKGKAVEVKCF